MVCEEFQHKIKTLGFVVTNHVPFHFTSEGEIVFTQIDYLLGDIKIIISGDYHSVYSEKHNINVQYTSKGLNELYNIVLKLVRSERIKDVLYGQDRV